MFKICIRLMVCLYSFNCAAQLSNTVAIDSITGIALTDAEELGDSLFWYAQVVESSSGKINYTAGLGAAIRLRGLYYEINGSYDTAMRYYLNMEQFGRQHNDAVSESAALSSQVMVQIALRQYDEARKKAFRVAAITKQNGLLRQLAVNYSYIGVTYRRQQLYDSAFIYYKKALEIREQMKDSAGISNTNINISSLLIYMEKFEEALQYIFTNVAYHKRTLNDEDLWYDYVNAASAFGGMKNFKAGFMYIDSALAMALKSNNKEQEANTYKSRSELYHQQGNWKDAYNDLLNATDMEAENINASTAKQLLELQEKYKAKQKEQQNQLLQASLTEQQLKHKNLWMIAGAIALIAVISFTAYLQIRNRKLQLQQQNAIINNQNKKLVELNDDKNQLISIVSHDLSQPLMQIKIWNEIIQKKYNEDPQLLDAAGNISSSVAYGEQLIHHILHVEKEGASDHALRLVPVYPNEFLQQLTGELKPIAANKNIGIEFTPAAENKTFITDKQHLRQITENLIGNAIKFSKPGTKVIVAVNQEKNNLIVEIKDEGPGIREDELGKLFNKYSIAASKPTAGESSTGLGLFIVKRLMLELGGKIEVESGERKGTTFRLVFSN